METWGDLLLLKTPVRNHRLTLVWKTREGETTTTTINNNNNKRKKKKVDGIYQTTWYDIFFKNIDL